MNTLDYLKSIDACSPAVNWVASQPDQSLFALWVSCPRGEWLLWLTEELGVPIPDSAYRPTVLRALRLHVSKALRAADLSAEADRLASLSDDAAWAYAADTAYAAACAADAADADAAACAAADAAYAAAAADAAAACVAADAAAACVAADADAADAAEHAQCASEVRAAMGDAVVVALTKAMEVSR